MASIIRFEDVTFTYPNGFTAVEHINLDIERGSRVAIIGQNGAGKTTMVKMMNGLLKPTSGTVTVDGMNTADHTAAQLSRVTGYVFQNPDDQIFHNTVRAEIEYGPRELRQSDEELEQNVQWAAELCRLNDVLDENPYNLPLSIRKFVTIASVLAMNGPILVFDEPTAGQDLRGMQCLEDILRDLSDKGKTVVTITHDMDFVVDNFDVICVMAHHNLLRIGDAVTVFGDQRLLEESMLKKPYVGVLIDLLGLGSRAVNSDNSVSTNSYFDAIRQNDLIERMNALIAL